MTTKIESEQNIGMISTLLFLLAGGLSALGGYLLWEQLWRTPRLGEKQIGALVAFSLLLIVAAIFHLPAVQEGGLHFSLPFAVALCLLLVQAIYLAGIRLHGTKNLGLFLLPATALPLLLLPLLPTEPSTTIRAGSILEAGHLIVSMLAYAILTVAALHALMQLVLDRALKRKQLKGVMTILPSLFEIENHLFAQVKGAVWLLALGILTGLSWQWEALGAFSLVTHKILLAIVSWVVLVMLLVLRRRLNWSNRRASYMVLAAYALLLLGYFGVKLIHLAMGRA